MNYKKHISILGLLIVGIVMSCRDESLYPLDYNDRTQGAYLRMYSITSNVFDVNDFANSAFETTFETVDPEGGNLLEEIEFYASFRIGTTTPPQLTDEVLVKTVPASVFVEVPEPTYSEFKRATIRITHAETHAALLTAPTQTGTEFWPSLARKISYPGSIVAGQQVVYRWKMKLTNRQEFSVFNPQNTNQVEANSTANITGGQYYSSPFQFTMTARTLEIGSFVNNYLVEQVSIWSPSHSVALHRSSFPASLNEEIFADQTVTLTKPTGGLSTQREFQISYKGGNRTVVVNFEQSDPLTGQTAGNTTAALTTLGWGTAPASTRPRGTVFIPLQNSTVACSGERQIYWATPTGGLFGSTAYGNNPAGSAASGVDPALPALSAGEPQGVTPNRGVYFTDVAGGTVAGEVFYLTLDDDADEYGRLNGYCTWTRRVLLKFTKV